MLYIRIYIYICTLHFIVWVGVIYAIMQMTNVKSCMHLHGNSCQNYVMFYQSILSCKVMRKVFGKGKYNHMFKCM